MTRFGSTGFAAALAPALAIALASPLAAAPAAANAAPTRLVLVGGGQRPPEAMSRFVTWAGGPAARLLVVTWASGEPKESCDALLKELEPHHPASAVCGPAAVLDGEGKASPLGAADAERLLDELAGASGVFFTGGDQARVMDVLADQRLLAALRRRYEAGVVFGGTSAGTAIMSKTMITGDGDFTVIDASKVGVRAGLGLLDGVIVDQHFVRRQRENRLFGLVLASPTATGAGIDEDTALLVSGGSEAEVVGTGVVVIVEPAGTDRLTISLRRPGQRFALNRH